MIKAVSRQILEVSQTGNTYFEKAWLMVAPELMNAGADTLEAEAGEYLRSLDAPCAIKRRRRIALKALTLLASAASGGLVTAALINLY